jgi:hypothetical protein
MRRMLPLWQREGHQPVEHVINELQCERTVYYDYVTILSLHKLWLLLDVLIPCARNKLIASLKSGKSTPRNGENVALTPPTPNPMRTMEAASPGTPTPFSRATGNEVVSNKTHPQTYNLDDMSSAGPTPAIRGEALLTPS